MEELKNILLVGVGGFAGSAARYSVSLLAKQLFLSTALPFATMGINVIGSFIIGVLFRMLSHGEMMWMLIVVGFCGGFTTFSTFSLETVTLIHEGSYSAAFMYALLSVLLCLLATIAGAWVAKFF